MTLSDRKHFQSFEKNPKTGHYCSKVFVQGEKNLAKLETCIEIGERKIHLTSKFEVQTFPKTHKYRFSNYNSKLKISQ